MPLYDLECPKCGHQEEVFKKYGSGEPEMFCPECSGELMQVDMIRVVSPSNFHLKGPGWTPKYSEGAN